jgi:hypothetical protein
MQEAAAHPHFRMRCLSDRLIRDGTRSAPALRVPLDQQFLRERAYEGWPILGEANALLDDTSRASPASG